MGAYVLDEPTPSTDAGAACWAGAGGLATTVVMVACGRPCEKQWEGLQDCRSASVAGSCMKSATPSVEGCAQPGQIRGWCNTGAGGWQTTGAGQAGWSGRRVTGEWQLCNAAED